MCTALTYKSHFWRTEPSWLINLLFNRQLCSMAGYIFLVCMLSYPAHWSKYCTTHEKPWYYTFNHLIWWLTGSSPFSYSYLAYPFLGTFMVTLPEDLVWWVSVWKRAIMDLLQKRTHLWGLTNEELPQKWPTIPYSEPSR